MKTLEHVLGQHPLFEGLLPEHLEFLTDCATRVRFEAHEPIFREGGIADRFYVIEEGKVELDIFLLEPGPMRIQTIGPGDVLGWSWLVPPYRWRFDANALEPTVAVALDGRRLREECEQGHHLGYELLSRFALILETRLQATRQQLLEAWEAHH